MSLIFKEINVFRLKQVKLGFTPLEIKKEDILAL